MTKYMPEPIDTSSISVPNDLSELVEKLAANTHDVWARQRIEDGWTFGSSRNDDRKEHPGLVPYTELTESEKNYDRIMVEQTVKAILALGYEIRRR